MTQSSIAMAISANFVPIDEGQTDRCGEYGKPDIKDTNTDMCNRFLNALGAGAHDIFLICWH